MSISIHAAKSQNFVNISGAQNRWAKYLEFIFFFLKRQGYVDISPEQKSTWCHIIFIHKSCNEIVNKIVFISLKAGHK